MKDLGKGEAEDLGKRGCAGLNQSLEEDIRVWKTSYLLLLTSGWNFLLPSAKEPHTTLKSKKGMLEGWTKAGVSAADIWSTRQKKKFSPFAFTITVTALPSHMGIMYQPGFKCSWVLSTLQVHILEGRAVVMFYQHTIRSHPHHVLKQLIHLLTSRW